MGVFNYVIMDLVLTFFNERRNYELSINDYSTSIKFLGVDGIEYLMVASFKTSRRVAQAKIILTWDDEEKRRVEFNLRPAELDHIDSEWKQATWKNVAFPGNGMVDVIFKGRLA